MKAIASSGPISLVGRLSSFEEEEVELIHSDLSLLDYLLKMRKYLRRLERGLIIWIKGRIYVDSKLDGHSLLVCPLRLLPSPLSHLPFCHSGSCHVFCLSLGPTIQTQVLPIRSAISRENLGSQVGTDREVDNQDSSPSLEIWSISCSTTI